MRCAINQRRLGNEILIMTNLRIGQGYDLHRLTENRELILGGIKIPYELGLLGHSDADVLIHAIMDALLGALSLGDIGLHFPPTDEKYKDISSIKLLHHVRNLLLQNNAKIVNIDSTIMAQRPKILPFIQDIRKNLAHELELELENVSVKATTTEKCDDVGKGLAIAASAIVLIEKI